MQFVYVGAGKTSTATALANELGCDVYHLPLNGLDSASSSMLKQNNAHALTHCYVCEGHVHRNGSRLGCSSLCKLLK